MTYETTLARIRRERRARTSTPTFGTATSAEAMRRSQQRLARLQSIASQEGIQEPEPKPSMLERIVDILMRPNYAVAGVFDELLNGQSNDVGEAVGGAAQRAMTELFSGMGGLEGQKETWGKVLADAGVGEGIHPSELVPFIYNQSGKGWRLKRQGILDPSARGALGLALDVATDPLTYVSMGTSRGAIKLLEAPASRKTIASLLRQQPLKELAQAGKIPLTKLGQSKWTELLKETRHLIPETQREELLTLVKALGRHDGAARLSKMLKEADLGGDLAGVRRWTDEVARLTHWTDDEIVSRSFDIWAGSHKASAEAATKAILTMADGGFNGLIDRGGVKWMGRTIVAGERFRPIGRAASRMFRQWEERGGLARAFVRGAKGVDAAFNEVHRAGRKIPGHITRIGRMRSERRRMIATLTSDLNELVPAGWRKQAVESGMPLEEYIARHLDNPKKYPASKLPAVIAEGVVRISDMLNQAALDEIRLGLLGEKSARLDYFPHMVRNSPEEMRRFVDEYRRLRMGRAAFKETPYTAWQEVRVFDTFDDMEKAAAEMKVPLQIDFDLRRVLERRMRGHIDAVTLRNHEVRMLRTYGLDDKIVAAETFKHAFPEIHSMVDSAIREIEPAMSPNAVRRGPVKGKALQLKFRGGGFGEPSKPGKLFAAEYAVRQAALRGKLDPLSERIAKDIRSITEEMDTLIEDYTSRSLSKEGMDRFRQLSEWRAELGHQQKLVDKYAKMPKEQLIHEPPSQGDLFGNINKETVFKTGQLIDRHAGMGIGKGGEKINLVGLNPTEKALYFLGRIRGATDLRELQKLLSASRRFIEEAAPGLPEQLRRVIGDSRRNYLAAFNEPMVSVASIINKRNENYLKPFRDMVLPEPILDTINRFGERLLNQRETRGMLNLYDWMMDVFKVYVTAPFPGFHFRNHLTNTVQNYLDVGLRALDPVRAKQVLDVMRGADGTLLAGGSRYTYGEIRALMQELNILQPSGAIFEIVSQTGRRDVVRDNPLVRSWHAGGRLIENDARATLFLNHLERGLDPMEASLRVQQALFDYESMSPIHREFFRRLFPFPTWFMRNIGYQARKLVTEPGRVLAQLKPADWGRRGPDDDLLPEYMRGRFKIKLHSKGKKIWLTNIDMPFANAIEEIFGSANRNVFYQQVNNMAPALKFIVEMGSGRDLFTGKSMQERAQLRGLGRVIKHLPKPARDWLEFQETTGYDGRPEFTANGTKTYLLFKSWAISRIYSEARRLEQQPIEGSFVVDLLTNMGTEEFDLTQQQKRTLNARLRRLEAELKRKGKLRSYEITYRPKR